MVKEYTSTIVNTVFYPGEKILLSHGVRVRVAACELLCSAGPGIYLKLDVELLTEQVWGSMNPNIE